MLAAVMFMNSFFFFFFFLLFYCTSQGKRLKHYLRFLGMQRIAHPLTDVFFTALRDVIAVIWKDWKLVWAIEVISFRSGIRRVKFNDTGGSREKRRRCAPPHRWIELTFTYTSGVAEPGGEGVGESGGGGGTGIGTRVAKRRWVWMAGIGGGGGGEGRGEVIVSKSILHTLLV